VIAAAARAFFFVVYLWLRFFSTVASNSDVL